MPVIAAEPQHNRALPLLRDLRRLHQDGADERQRDERDRIVR